MNLDTLLLTANVGSLFENDGENIDNWIDAVSRLVSGKSPSFVAIHCQEVGGKNYEQTMQYVDGFIKRLLSDSALADYTSRVYLDQDFSVEDRFTALGCLFFVRKSSAPHIHLWDFATKRFTPVTSSEVVVGNIEAQTVLQKVKFPKEFYVENKWSRKGFIRTRWRFRNMFVELVNVHLLHDTSNLLSLEQNPSIYVQYRRRALLWMFDWLSKDSAMDGPLFVFGDFNFRVNISLLTQRLVEAGCRREEVRGGGGGGGGPGADLTGVVYRSIHDGTAQISVGVKKYVQPKVHDCAFLGGSRSWFREMDTEPVDFRRFLHEYAVNFPPSYPFVDAGSPSSYAHTRCPSWCDRVLFNAVARQCIATAPSPQYDMIATDTCVGDHKPIFLHFVLQTGGAGAVAGSPTGNAAAPATKSAGAGANTELTGGINTAHTTDDGAREPPLTNNRGDGPLPSPLPPPTAGMSKFPHCPPPCLN